MQIRGAAAISGSQALLPSQKTKDVRLQRACQDFEGIFLTMLWREMQKSTDTDLGGWDAFAEQAIGRQWAKSGGIGLAKVIYKSVSKHLPK